MLILYTAAVCSCIPFNVITLTVIKLDCNTRYYPNYYVQNARSPDAVRIYYNTPINYIQSSQHFYIASSLCELFATMMVTSWYAFINLFSALC